MQSSVDTSRSSAPERRKHLRVTFSALRRPQLILPLGTHAVVDASLGGLRIAHSQPARPKVGARVTGTLEWIHGEPPLQLEGEIVRVDSDSFAMRCPPGAIPLGYLPWEQAR